MRTFSASDWMVVSASSVVSFRGTGEPSFDQLCRGDSTVRIRHDGGVKVLALLGMMSCTRSGRRAAGRSGGGADRLRRSATCRATAGTTLLTFVAGLSRDEFWCSDDQFTEDAEVVTWTSFVDTVHAAKRMAVSSPGTPTKELS